MKYSLRQIEVFLATAKLQNITRAASELAMSQSAASGALKDLEERYDAPLFDRLGKRLQLNALGKTLLPAAEALMSQAKEVDAVLAQQQALGSISVGATMTIGNYLMVPIVSRFKRNFPSIDVHLHVANTTEIANQIVNFELDVGFLEGEYRHPDLKTELWQDDELVVFCAPSHPLAAGKQLKIDQLDSVEWILRESGSGTRQAFDHVMYGLEDRIRVFLELEHTEAIKRAVEVDSCLGCLSRITVQDALDGGRFCELTFTERDMRRQLYRVTHRKKYIFKALQMWMDYCDTHDSEADSDADLEAALRTD